MSQDGKRSGSHLSRTSVFHPTRVLAGKYRLGRMLGEGGMGAVYEAEHEGLGSRVAVKLLSEAGLSDHKALTRFRREARAMGAIKHENVVTVMDTGTDEEGSPFLVMELLEGESLAAMLRRERVLSPGLATWVATEMLAGLHAAHNKGVIHRDLKPGNVFIATLDGGGHRVKILDFGISKVGDSSPTLNVTADGALVGTPNFMAPEQIRANVEIDPRVDIYATGIILYRMVSGYLPYVGANSEELYRRILEARPTPPTQHRPNIPPALEAVIMRSMHPDRDARFSNAPEFIEALRESVPEVDRLARQTGTGSSSYTTSRPPPTEDVSDPRYAAVPMAADYVAPDTVAGRPSAMRKTPAHSSAFSSADGSRGRGWLSALLGLVAVGAIAGGIYAFSARGEGGEKESIAPVGEAVVTPLSESVRLGIVRHKSRDTIDREMAPLIDYLEDELEQPVLLVIVDSYKDLANDLDDGEVEIAALSAWMYVSAQQRGIEMQLLATPVTATGSSYEGYILARTSDRLSSLEDLKGKRFCYVSDKSSSGYLYPRALFRKEGIDPDKDFSQTIFTADHFASIRYLTDNQCDGAAVYASAWHDARSQGIDPTELTLLARTDSIPWDAYAVSTKLDPELTDAIRQSLVALEPDSPLAKKIFAGSEAPFIGFQPGDDSLYQPVRRIARYLDRADE